MYYITLQISVFIQYARKYTSELKKQMFAFNKTYYKFSITLCCEMNISKAKVGCYN